MPLPRRRSSFLGQQAPSSATESVGGPGRRVSVGSLSRPPGVYVGAVPTGGVSSLGTRVSRRALGISSVFLQGLRSSCSAVPLAAGLEKGRGLSYESLNGCLVEYIEKVRALEQVNQELEEHIRVYLDKKSSSVGSWGALRESWEAVYHQVSGGAWRGWGETRHNLMRAANTEGVESVLVIITAFLFHSVLWKMLIKEENCLRHPVHGSD